MSEELNSLKKQIEELQNIHAICCKCHKVGHKVDMVQYRGYSQVGTDGFMFPQFYHEKCFKEKE